MREEHRTSPQDASGGDEETGSPTDGTPADPPGRWWITPAVFGAAAALLVLAAFSPWSWGLSDDFGTAPWWVAIPALVAAVLLVGGLGTRRTVRWAVAAAALAACLGLFAFARSPAEELPRAPRPYQFLAADPPRPAAALAAALACLAAIGLCVLLARRQGFRLPPAAAGGTRRRARRLLAVVVGGALAGSLLSVGTDQVAQSVQQALADTKKSVFDATSQTLPEERRGKGHDISAAEHHEPVPHLKPEKTLWRKKLPGPVELTTCVLDRPKDNGWRVDQKHRNDPLVTQSTLVAVESVSGGNAVVGYDAADGSERWRYTVRDTELTLPRLDKTYTTDSRLGQVGVSDFCRVHVVVDPLTLVTLDGSSGEVKNTTQLPSPASWKDRAFNWAFATESYISEGGEDQDVKWQPLVPLGHADQIYVQTSRQLVEVDHWTGKVLAVTKENKGCFHLATHERRSARTIGAPLVLAQGCTSPYYTQIPERPADLGRGVDETDLAYDGLSRLISHRQDTVPRLGCDRAPRISDVRDGPKGVVVVGRWCDDYDGPLLVGKDYDDEAWGTVVELPKNTELPLRPYAPRFGDVLWLSHGSLYRLEPARGRVEGQGSYQKLYAEDGEPLEALVPPATRRDDALDEHPGAFYAMTASGTLLALTYGEKEGKNGGVVAEVTGRMAKAAGECAGTRDLLVDRAGVKLLALCETDGGTEVTAITGKRLTKAEWAYPHSQNYKQYVSH
ncbi:hypothetical protein ACIQPT_26125 [Streptomyces sp. NPDC091289]|uniref:hypothetical protein n=1 Tax=Streptomyces sp. NPDC091289 TaxID=3365989 RepID=UPI0037F4968A